MEHLIANSLIGQFASHMAHTFCLISYQDSCRVFLRSEEQSGAPSPMECRANNPWLIRVRLLKLRGEQTLRDGARELHSYFVIFLILLLNNCYLTFAERLASITNIPTPVPSVFFGYLMDRVKGSGTVAILMDNARLEACIQYGGELGPSSATVSVMLRV